MIDRVSAFVDLLVQVSNRLPGGRIARRAAGGALVGAFFALMGMAVGAIRIALALLGGGTVGLTGVGWGLLIYGAGFMTGGAVVGLLWPMRSSWLGRYLLGIVGATIVFAFLSRFDRPSLTDWSRGDIEMALTLGTIFGVVMGYQFGKDK